MYEFHILRAWRPIYNAVQVNRFEKDTNSAVNSLHKACLLCETCCNGTKCIYVLCKIFKWPDTEFALEIGVGSESEGAKFCTGSEQWPLESEFLMKSRTSGEEFSIWRLVKRHVTSVKCFIKEKAFEAGMTSNTHTSREISYLPTIVHLLPEPTDKFLATLLMRLYIWFVRRNTIS